MLAITKTAALSGIEGVEVTVEADSERGLPSFHIIGLGDTAVKESSERVRGAILNSGFEYPRGRITVSLSPAWIHKKGSHYDLAVAVGILASQGILKQENLEERAFIGELTLNGNVSGVRGVLPMMTGLRKKVRQVFVAEENMDEAEFSVRDTETEVIPVKNLRELVEILQGKAKRKIYQEKTGIEEEKDSEHDSSLDFADIRGHEEAKEAIVTAVTGKHGLLLIGSPGTGKTMLARRIPTILPDMTAKEQLETSMIYSLAGKLDQYTPYISRRPFREINKTVTPAGMLGGGIEPMPGEISYAHNGILFMDEFLEFPREKTELLRKPMEDGKIRILRRGQLYVFPASFSLIAASNPCPCGFLGDETHACRCSQAEIDRYRIRLSGPLRDRMDMCLEIRRVDYETLENSCTQSSEQMKKRVMTGVDMQKQRFRGLPIQYNSQMNEQQIRIFCRLGKEEKKFMQKAYQMYEMSPRRYHKVLRLARTIADLEESQEISVRHLAGALRYTVFFEERS